MRSSIRSASRLAIAASLAGAALLCSAQAAEPLQKSADAIAIEATAMRVQVFDEKTKTPLIDTVLPLRAGGDSLASSSASVPYLKSVSRDGQGRLKKVLDVARDGAFVKVSRGKEADEYVITVETRSVEMNSVSVPLPSGGAKAKPAAEGIADADSAWEAARQALEEPGSMSSSSEQGFEMMAAAGAPEEQMMRVDLPTAHIRSSSFAARLKPGSSTNTAAGLGEGFVQVVATLIK